MSHDDAPHFESPTPPPGRRRTRHLHIYGAPGVGKSTLAAVIYAEMKLAGISVELVQEYAQEHVWAGTLDSLLQGHITLEQIRREEALIGKVDWIVTDSPPLLGPAYADIGQDERLRHRVMDLTDGWRTNSLFLTRGPIRDAEFEQEGRIHNAKESAVLEKRIQRIMQISGIEATLVRCSSPNQLRLAGQSVARMIKRHRVGPVFTDAAVHDPSGNAIESSGDTQGNVASLSSA